MWVDALRAVFFPRSVAVVGASATKGKLGNTILLNTISCGFPGKIFPVNPKAKEILGLPAYPSLTTIPESVDLAVVSLPSQLVLEAVEAAAEKGVRGMIIISAGFAETRGAAQMETERRILAIAREAKMAVIGPNCQGVLSTRGKVCAWFGPIPKHRGQALFITQSGGLAGTLIEWTNRRHISLFDTVVSLGNKCCIDEADVITYFGSDPNIKLIMCYIEGFKPTRGRAFMESVMKLCDSKPVVVLKGGRYTAGVRATITHTGSLAGSDRVFAGAMRQAGVILTNSIREFINASRLLMNHPSLRGPRIVVITNLGGPGVITADLCERFGLEVPPTPEPLKGKLRNRLPSYCAVGNPIDLAGDPAPERYRAVLEVVYEEDTFDGVLIVAAPLTGAERIATDITRISQNVPKPTAICWMDEASQATVRPIFETAGLPVFEMPEDAVRAMAALWRERGT